MRINLNNRSIVESPFTQFCANYCRRLLSDIKKAKTEIVSQFRNVFVGEERLLKSALNEAEALAFLSGYPHLVFPTLAMEKVQTAAAWTVQQKQIRRSRGTFARF